MIQAAKAKLEQRVEALKANERARVVSGEEQFTAWQEESVLQWLEGPHEKGEHFVYLFVSSALRDPVRFPNPGEFKLALSAEIDNVIKAELVQASIPLVDPTVNNDNNALRFSITNHAVVYEATIPEGCYLGVLLAPELTRQMNQVLFSAQILAAAYYIDPATGAAFDTATSTWPVGVDQPLVSFSVPRQQMLFQMVDDAGLPTAAVDLGLHLRPPPSDNQAPRRVQTDDVWDLLGFDRITFSDAAAALGQFNAGTDTYYLLSTNTVPGFTGDPVSGVPLSVDARYRYALHSSHAVDLRGANAVVLDIDPLNDNDIAVLSDPANTGALTLGDYFGFLLLRDPANVSDRICELTNNSFPIRKYYREGRGRFNSLTVKMRRPDGTIFDFGGNDFFLTIRLTVTHPQQKPPVFAR